MVTCYEHRALNLFYAQILPILALVFDKITRFGVRIPAVLLIVILIKSKKSGTTFGLQAFGTRITADDRLRRS